MDTKKDISSIAMYCNKNKKKTAVKTSQAFGRNRRESEVYYPTKMFGKSVVQHS